MRTTRQAKSPTFRYSPMVAALAMAFAPQALASPYEVTNTLSGGAGSLRDAITYANDNCGTNRAPTITFNITTEGTGPFIIAQSPSLLNFTCVDGPAIPYTPTVDGTSQPSWTANTQPDGFDANLQIILDGTAYGGCGLNLDGQTSYGGILTVKGLEIRNYDTAGLCGNIVALGNKIYSNDTGVRLADNSSYGGSSAIGDGSFANRNVIGGNESYGIEVQYGGNVTAIRKNFIGTLNGTTATANGTGIRWMGGSPGSDVRDNVISGNSGTGLYIEQASNLTVANNKMGVDVTGNSPLANGGHGVWITNITYGGPSLSSNTISGNSNIGIVIQDGESVTLTGNMIGTNTAGTAKIANAGQGLKALCMSDLVLRGNTISGNTSHGVEFAGVDDSFIETSNKIGTNAAGATTLGNNGAGVVIGSTSCINEESGSRNTLSDNVIAYNGEDGVAINSGVSNTLTRNTIRDNGTSGGKNININDSGPGPLPNDPPDPLPGPYDTDGGPNNQQNYPTVTSVVSDGDGSMRISYKIRSAALTTYRVEVFSNPSAGTPGGTYRNGGPTDVTTDTNGDFSATLTRSGTFDNVSLTATNLSTNDTSEFSPIVSIEATPSVSLSSEDLDFGNIAVGSGPSPTQTVDFRSNGTAPWRISKFDIASCYGGGAFCYGGGFTCTTTCTTGLDYAPSPSPVCSLTARFEPTFYGAQSTTILICDNVGAPSHTITLTGNGVVPPVISIDPSQWDFGNGLVGRLSPVKRFTVSNPNSAPATLGSLSTTGTFALVDNNCTNTLPPGGSCFGDVAFAPTQPGFTSGALVVPVAGGLPPGVLAPGGGPKVSEMTTVNAPLYGTGIQAAALSMPSSVVLPAFTVGGAPSSKAIELTNTGNAVLTFSSITATAPFTVANACPVNLPPGETCIVTVGFSTPERGTFNGTLTVVSNAPGGSRAIPISINAQTEAAPLIHVAPTFIGFGARMIGTQSTTQQVTITNDGGAPATISSMGVGVDYLLINSSCGATLAAAATCFAEVAFRPIGFGPRPGQFTFSSNSPGTPFVVEMLGTGCRPFTISNRAGATSACAP